MNPKDITSIRKPGREIPFRNPMLLIERTGLNAIGLVEIKAKSGKVPVPINNGLQNESVSEIYHADGPSFYFPWWPEYGPTPVPGQWIEITARVRDLNVENYPESEVAV